MRIMVGDSPAQRKLISYLRKRDPKLKEKELLKVLNNIKRFVNLARKIYTEPQAKVVYKDRKVGEKIVKDRIFNTTQEELEKTREKPSETFVELVRKTHKKMTKGKYE